MNYDQRNLLNNSVNKSENKQKIELLDALANAEHKPKVTNPTSLASSILAKIAAKKKGN